MLVNRRTDYVDAASGQMKYLTPSQLRTPYGTNGHADGFTLAPPQNVKFGIQAAIPTFGNGVALYDPYSQNVYLRVSDYISVPIDPGDGIMLEMCSAAPPNVNSPITLSKKAYITTNVSINTGGSLTITPGTNCRIFDDVTITINSGGSLNFSGYIQAGEHVQIAANPGSTLNLTGAVFIFKEGTNFCLNGTSFTATDCDFDSMNLIISGGFYIALSDVSIQSSHFRNYNSFRIENSDLELLNCRFEIATGKTGIELKNTIEGHVTSISASVPEMGFFLQPQSTEGNTTGLKISSMQNPMTVTGIEFQDLAYGIVRYGSDSIIGQITNCHFNNCNTGAYYFGTGNSGNFDTCYFYNNANAGISSTYTMPGVKACTFTECNVGIRIESLQDPKCKTISESSFINCWTAIECVDSTPQIVNSYFFHNNNGLLCHNGSNPNLCYDANNVLRNSCNNIEFSSPSPYIASIQLFKGHNDFYHELHDGVLASDFSFDENYYNSPITIEHTIDASRNWFQDGNIRVDPLTSISNVYCDSYDPYPNVDNIPPDNPRFFQALDFEEQGQFEPAMAIYKAIVEENHASEAMFMTSAIEGVYRISFCINDPNWNAVDYFDSKVIQYMIEDPVLSDLLEKYTVKSLIVNKEYQAAIDIIQVRIDSPYSPLDSLMAVLELETLLELAASEGNKAPVSTCYPQLIYADEITFTSNHSKHWAQLHDLINKSEESEIPIPRMPIIATNYPNPFNPSTTIEFSIPEKSNIKVEIYNTRGQKVKDLISIEMLKGPHKVVWDGKDNNGGAVSSGIYFACLESNGSRSTRKLMLMK